MMLADALRGLWLPGIQAASIDPQIRLSGWIEKGQYYFDSEVGPDSATFILTPGASLQGCFAGEVIRFASAAFETAIQIEQHSHIPQSLGWLVIQSYYAAYFAGHALIRSAGLACTQIEGPASQKINEIANLLGMPSTPFSSGAYRCKYELSRGAVVARKPSGKGVHEQFWSVFVGFLRESSQTILSNGALPATVAQPAANHIDDLVRALVSQGCNGGNWLSMMRNRVNYRQELDTWFPEWPKKSYCDSLFHIQKQWRREPDLVGVSDTDDLKRFMRACSFTVALSRATILELAKRSSQTRPPLTAAVSRFLRD